MSTISDYKLYKKYEPDYKTWKEQRDIQEAKRLEYIKLHPELRNENEVKRGKALLRAVDIMDEYSQKRAEDTETATETIMAYGLNILFIIGSLIGVAVGKIPPVEKYLNNLLKPMEAVFKAYAKTSAFGKNPATIVMSALVGGLLGTIGAFPLTSWASKKEVKASRKGRFEAMYKELNNPNGFAVLTNEQTKLAKEKSKDIYIKEPNKITAGLSDSMKAFKEMVHDSPEYKHQRNIFEYNLKQKEALLDKPMSEKEQIDAKRDQQLLTKIVEKIDIASQDYAENTELALQALVMGIGAFGALFTAGLSKVLNKMNVKSAGKITAYSGIATFIATIGTAIATAQIQKQASRVGRYKIKQELLSNPDNFIYVDNEKLDEIKNVHVQKHAKEGIFAFLKHVWKDNKEYNKYQKTKGKEDQKFFKAMNGLKLSEKQLEEAKQLQQNTFMVFNKVDEKSQKYAESVEAMGKSVTYPLVLLFSTIASIIAPFIVFKKPVKTKAEMANAMLKTIAITFASIIPAIYIEAKITKEQKKASRIADMIAINEMSDYRKFRA